MPNWFRIQMTNAFLTKNIYQIKMLNQCWFFYLDRRISK
ncbi:cortex morphogenetic protein CmpA [Paraliobacillus sp. PM-2]|nr:cortex morphogenetic protein CmpA [Paraliobacillus sp. PM-2]